MTNEIIISTYTENGITIKISVKDYEILLSQKNKTEIAKLIYFRLFNRYVYPFQDCPNKNGFLMMASSCLLIETLESFYQGWEDTQTKSKQSFERYFERSGHLKLFHKRSLDFYNNVRCAILHQGETTKGWKITRKGSLIDETSSTINAVKFLKGVEQSLIVYRTTLEISDWDSEVWDNLRRKMRFIIKNCNTTYPR